MSQADIISNRRIGSNASVLLIVATLAMLASFAMSWFFITMSHLLLYDTNSTVFNRLPSEESSQVIGAAQTMLLGVAVPLAVSNLLAIIAGWWLFFSRR